MTRSRTLLTSALNSEKTTYPTVIKHPAALVSGIINVAFPGVPNKWLRSAAAPSSPARSGRITVSLRDLQNRLLTATGSTRTCSFDLARRACPRDFTLSAIQIAIDHRFPFFSPLRGVNRPLQGANERERK